MTLIKIRSSVTDERKKAEAAKLAQEIERDRKKFFRVVKDQPDLAGELDRSIDKRSRELYERARDAAGVDR